LSERDTYAPKTFLDLEQLIFFELSLICLSPLGFKASGSAEKMCIAEEKA
jgi:hypothetical protein